MSVAVLPLFNVSYSDVYKSKFERVISELLKCLYYINIRIIVFKIEFRKLSNIDIHIF